jgi:hypothetical protein
LEFDIGCGEIAFVLFDGFELEVCAFELGVDGSELVGEFRAFFLSCGKLFL